MDVKFLTGTQSGYEKMSSHDSGTFYLTENNVYLGDFLLTLDDSVNEALQEIAKNASAIEDLENEIGGLSSLDTPTKTTIVAAINIEDLENEIGDLSSLDTATKTTIVDAINEIYDSMSVVEEIDIIDTGEVFFDDYAKVYIIIRNGITIGTVSISKDLVIKGGKVKANPTGQEEGLYIVLNLDGTDDQKMYINIRSLADIYIAEQNDIQMQLVTNGTEISAKLVANEIETSELINNIVTIDKITDSNTTKETIPVSIQKSLDATDGAKEVFETYVNKLHDNARAELNKDLENLSYEENPDYEEDKEKIEDKFTIYDSQEDNFIINETKNELLS